MKVAERRRTESREAGHLAHLRRFPGDFDGFADHLRGRVGHLGPGLPVLGVRTSPLCQSPVTSVDAATRKLVRDRAGNRWPCWCPHGRARLEPIFNWPRTRQLVGAIERDVVGSLKPEQRTSLDGQTVLVVGNRGEGETFPWGYFQFWMLDANLGRFEKV